MSETIEIFGTHGLLPTSGTPMTPPSLSHGKILRFPTPDAESSMASGSGPKSAPVRCDLLGAPNAIEDSDSAALRTATAAWQRLATMRRRRPSRSTEAGAERTAGQTPVALERPSVAQLVTWMLNLRRGGVGFLYWNAAKLPMDVALMRAARLDDGAIVDVSGHRLLVVEPLRPVAGAAQVR